MDRVRAVSDRCSPLSTVGSPPRRWALIARPFETVAYAGLPVSSVRSPRRHHGDRAAPSALPAPRGSRGSLWRWRTSLA
jgi:hypothetical protein